MKTNLLQKNIPQGWRVVKIKDAPIKIADGNYSAKYPRQDEFKESGIPFVRVDNLQNQTLVKENLKYISEEKHSELKKGHLKINDVLITTRGQLGIIALVPSEFDDANINAQLVLLRADNKTLLPKFLMYFLLSPEFQSQVFSGGSGSALQQLPVGVLENTYIILPLPKEQQKISEILETVDEDIIKTQGIIKTTEKLKSGLMRQFFTRGIGHTKFKETKIGEIPEEWDVVEIKKIANVKAGNGFQVKYQGYKNGNIPFYKVSDMNLFGNEKYMNVANNYVDDELIKKIKGNFFPKGCVVYPKVGAALLGNKRRILTKNSLVDNNVGVLIPNEKIISEYLYYWMLQIDMAQFSGNGVLPAINASTVEKILIKLPKITEQKKIVSIIDSIDEKISVNKKLKEKLTQLKKGLMSDLLSGKVRIV